MKLPVAFCGGRSAWRETGRACDRVDDAFEGFAISVDAQTGFLPRTHVLELRLFEIGGDVDLIERNDCEEELSG